MAKNPLHTHYDAIFDELQRAGVEITDQIPFCQGKVMCTWPKALEALQMEETDLDGVPMVVCVEELIEEGSLKIVCCADKDGNYLGQLVEFINLIDSLVWWSTLASCKAYVDWTCEEVLPTYRKHGWYDPETGHQPPVGQEIEAAENVGNFHDTFPWTIRIREGDESEDESE
jgi:hypothetical protein